MDCCSAESPDILGTISNISSIITAIAGFALAFYVFVYQRKRDGQIHKLEWFKSLIIEPNKKMIYDFFIKISDITLELNAPQLTDPNKSIILSNIKTQSAEFRRDFLVLLQSVDHTMELDILMSIDFLIDKITTAAFDPAIDLSDEAEFDSHISIPISHLKNYLFSRLFRYDGQ